jgi:branched-chain amino acid transport system ATP-binding protein
MNSAPPILSVRHVRKSFRGIHVLQDVSFDVQAGSITALVGSNGAGKSTLVNVMSGALPADGGEVRLNGIELSKLAAHRRARAGLLRTFQHPRVFGSFSVRESIELAQSRPGDEGFLSSLASVFRSRRSGQVSDTPHKVLEPLMSKSEAVASSLGYGEKKLLMLAQLMATTGEVLCFDELCAGLEPVVVQEVRECLQSLAAAGKAVIFVEHNLALVRSLATRVIFLHQGRVYREGDVDTVLTDPEVVALYLGE